MPSIRLRLVTLALIEPCRLCGLFPAGLVLSLLHSYDCSGELFTEPLARRASEQTRQVSCSVRGELLGCPCCQ